MNQEYHSAADCCKSWKSFQDDNYEKHACDKADRFLRTASNWFLGFAAAYVLLHLVAWSLRTIYPPQVMASYQLEDAADE